MSFLTKLGTCSNWQSGVDHKECVGFQPRLPCCSFFYLAVAFPPLLDLSVIGTHLGFVHRKGCHRSKASLCGNGLSCPKPAADTVAEMKHLTQLAFNRRPSLSLALQQSSLNEIVYRDLLHKKYPGIHNTCFYLYHCNNIVDPEN